VAVTEKNEAAALDATASFRALLRPWLASVIQAAEYDGKHEEWKFSHAVWRHGGRHGAEPVGPVRPTDIPDVPVALDIVKSIHRLYETTNTPFAHLSDISVRWPLESMIHDMDLLLSAIETAEAKANAPAVPAPEKPPREKDDGLIDRNQLAKLLGVTKKALTERRRELPEPIGRGQKMVPIYRFADAIKAASKMYPDRAFLVPATFSEAMDRLRQMSKEAKHPGDTGKPS
jgi:hypothetical protein